MTYLIVGVGYTGSRVAQRLADHGYDVTGTVRESEHSFAYPVRELDLADRGSVERFWDEFTSDSLRIVFTPGPSIREGFDEAFKMMEGFVDSIPRDRLEKFVYLSSTSVYGDTGGEWVNESSPTDPYSRSGELRQKIERLLVREFEPEQLLRCRIGGIYGPGRNPAERYLSDDYEIPGGEENWTNRIRVEDLVRAISLLTVEDYSGVYNLVDNRPSRLLELVQFAYRRTGRDPAHVKTITWDRAHETYSEKRLGLLRPQKRVSSQKLRSDLAFTYRYPTPFHGLFDLM